MCYSSWAMVEFDRRRSVVDFENIVTTKLPRAGRRQASGASWRQWLWTKILVPVDPGAPQNCRTPLRAQSDRLEAQVGTGFPPDLIPEARWCRESPGLLGAASAAQSISFL